MAHKCFYECAMEGQTNQLACVPSEDSDQPRHLLCLISVVTDCVEL